VVAERSDLIAAWASGWAVSRGAPPPTGIDGGWRIEGDRTRYVLETDNWCLATELGHAAIDGTEIKVAGDTGRLRSALPTTWTMYPANHMMTTTFTHGAPTVPASCTAQVEPDGAAFRATIHDSSGEIISTGRLAPHGSYGIIDRVRTGTGHQRRGLGRAVMTLLVNRALDEGLTNGLLSATAEGRALYVALGWRVRSEVAGAFRSGADISR
jgi:GNAT superfamily N-acetyltransferase